ncbi:FecR domain-containing protein [Porticoccus sp. W117]|uniref:FecR family protein n=1 Tax=Porticoccus sp. W117 TaxID=3054777 RepID=UPI00259973A2|nr:FecR domain-containing protein [Porticoccus sp. W117]MDM3870969.1 FecR domain-containing protein [Porticoccus sp. W117]
MTLMEEKILQEDVGYALMRLYSGELSEGEVAMIQQRSKAEPEFRHAYLGALEEIALVSSLEEKGQLSTILAPPKKNFRWLAVAASMMLALATTWFFMQPAEVQEYTDIKRYVSGVGEQRTITLEDGSQVSLNTATQLLIEMSDNQRRVILERGEAFFDVSEDPVRPFVVELGQKQVTVLGTSFNIFKTPDAYQVAVVEGLVALHDPMEPVDDVAVDLSNLKQGIAAPRKGLLRAGWLASYSTDSKHLDVVQPESMTRYSDWRKGWIQFDKEPMSDVVKELNRYAAKKILIEDKAVMDVNVTALVSVTELSATLNGLEQLLPIKVTHHFDRVVISEK